MTKGGRVAKLCDGGGGGKKCDCQNNAEKEVGLDFGLELSVKDLGRDLGLEVGCLELGSGLGRLENLGILVLRPILSGVLRSWLKSWLRSCLGIFKFWWEAWLEILKCWSCTSSKAGL